MEPYVPDGTSPDAALARTTDLVVGAHPDDAELLAPGVLATAREDPGRWCTVVVCTDGAGSVPPSDATAASDGELARRRAAEQRRAAALGRYSAVVQRGRPSTELRSSAGAAALRADLADLLVRCRPTRVLTHSPTDRHATHLAVVAAVVDAARSVPATARPDQLLGCEAWRDLDWLPADERVVLDVTGHEDMAAQLLGAFTSQLGAKRYDLAATGRRRANATFADPHQADAATEVVLAMDLTPLIRDEDLDPVEWVAAAVDRFRLEVVEALRDAWARAAG